MGERGEVGSFIEQGVSELHHRRMSAFDRISGIGTATIIVHTRDSNILLIRTEMSARLNFYNNSPTITSSVGIFHILEHPAYPSTLVTFPRIEPQEIQLSSSPTAPPAYPAAYQHNSVFFTQVHHK